jgi:hypothetical protein
MAEQLFCKQLVAGSIPVAGSINAGHIPVQQVKLIVAGENNRIEWGQVA